MKKFTPNIIILFIFFFSLNFFSIQTKIIPSEKKESTISVIDKITYSILLGSSTLIALYPLSLPLAVTGGSIMGSFHIEAVNKQEDRSLPPQEIQIYYSELIKKSFISVTLVGLGLWIHTYLKIKSLFYQKTKKNIQFREFIFLLSIVDNIKNSPIAEKFGHWWQRLLFHKDIASIAIDILLKKII